MSYAILAASLRSAMQRRDQEAIERLIADMQPADLAEFVQHEHTDTVLSLLQHLPLDQRAVAFGYLSEALQEEIALRLSVTKLAELLLHMSADERTDLFKQLDEDRQQALLHAMPRAEQEDLRKLSSYEEGTAGAIMTSDYVAIPAYYDVTRALATLRATGTHAETVYQLYCIDTDGRLLGTVSLRELILAEPDSQVAELMTEEVVFVTADTAQEEVARLVARYDLLALPVINGGERLVGIVTYDDAMDVAEEEATEDMHKGMSIGKLEGGLRSASLFDLYRKRVVWLVLLVFANIFSGAGIAYFEETIEAYIALVFFLPLLVDSGGNAGSQAATLMVRGMATGDVRTRDWTRLLGREVLVAVGLGLTMALAVSVVGIFRAGTEIAMVVAMSMVLIVIVGSLIGMILPFVLNRLGWDPATASAPLVTSIADASGVLIYFAIATAVLGLPV
ncbi:magnesium transporter [Halomonas daqingensis]|uniref:Magnesium transporter MgtE n=1 Tax=Billgrantia desiderata TaxID=52021 RepID=A0ABS9BA45_9GAMM|nr:magnesium transporter [Halomonas desiderata]MCE8044605.1 magnesium transporter [Halomonas desiderata]MCE8049112.1 magnesium transporter [Halomonas desiderata]